MNRRLLAVPMLVALMLAGCSDPQTPTTDGEPPSTATEDPPVTEGGDLQGSTSLPESCDITDTDIADFNRDWGRVAAGVGRPDWHDYTDPLVKTVSNLAERAKSCPGADHAAALVPLIADINADAENNEIDMDPINEFQIAGEAWLEALGYGRDALTTG